MSEINDGGPAFPGPDGTLNINGDFIPAAYTGMTLRDYFAGKAFPQALIDEEARPSTFIAGKYTPTVEGVALRAYGYADAMLKARARHG